MTSNQGGNKQSLKYIIAVFLLSRQSSCNYPHSQILFPPLCCRLSHLLKVSHSFSSCCVDVVIQEASMWTQKDVIAFKNAIKKESKMEKHTDCIIKVGSGETVNVSSAGMISFPQCIISKTHWAGFYWGIMVKIWLNFYKNHWWLNGSSRVAK